MGELRRSNHVSFRGGGGGGGGGRRAGAGGYAGGGLVRLCSEGALWRSYDAATRTEALRVVGRDPPTRGRAVNGSTRDEAPRIAAGRVLDAATGVARIVGAHVQVDIALVPA